MKVVVATHQVSVRKMALNSKSNSASRFSKFSKFLLVFLIFEYETENDFSLKNFNSVMDFSRSKYFVVPVGTI